MSGPELDFENLEKISLERDWTLPTRMALIHHVKRAYLFLADALAELDRLRARNAKLEAVVQAARNRRAENKNREDDEPCECGECVLELALRALDEEGKQG